MARTANETHVSLWVSIHVAGVTLEGDLRIPARASGVVVIPHGSGIRRGPRDGVVAQQMREAGWGTLLLPLLSAEEQDLDARTACFRFDSHRSAARLTAVIGWLAEEPTTRELPAGVFSGSSAAAAALLSVADRADAVGALVLHNGRPSLAAAELARVVTPTLILVGGDEEPDVRLDLPLLDELGTPDKQFTIVSIAPDGPDKPGGLEEVAHLAVQWFAAHSRRPVAAPRAEAQTIPA